MDAIKPLNVGGGGVGVGGGRGGRVGVAHNDHQIDDFNDGNMHCSEHPNYRPNQGGICAFCLQEKLGKLVSSSFPLPLRPSTTSSSSSPPFRSDMLRPSVGSTTATATNNNNNKSIIVSGLDSATTSSKVSRKTRIPFLVKSKKKVDVGSSSSSSSLVGDNNMVFKRSKSISTTSKRSNNHFDHHDSIVSPRKRNGGFWSFLYFSTSKRSEKIQSFGGVNATSSDVVVDGVMLKPKARNLMEENGGRYNGRKVSRSRSVGCGSRSFSGDFFERISTGFGDCTVLRRVESQREGKPKVQQPPQQQQQQQQLNKWK